MSRVVGLDLSLSATGVVTEDEAYTIKVGLPKNPSELDRVARLHRLVGLINRACLGSEVSGPADLVVIEGYGFNATHSPGHSLGELGGAVKLCLYQQGIPFAIPTSNQMKQWGTGRGNASKDGVLIAAVRSADNGRDNTTSHEITNNNEADAYFLWQMGIWAIDGKHESLSKVRQAVLESVEWPAVVKGR